MTTLNIDRIRLRFKRLLATDGIAALLQTLDKALRHDRLIFDTFIVVSSEHQQLERDITLHGLAFNLKIEALAKVRRKLMLLICDLELEDLSDYFLDKHLPRPWKSTLQQIRRIPLRKTMHQILEQVRHWGRHLRMM